MTNDLSTIATIRSYVAMSVGADASMIARRMNHLNLMRLDHISPQNMDAAVKAKNETLATLNKMWEAIVGTPGPERRKYAERRAEDRRERQRREA